MAFQIAVYSFIGIELIGVTAGETKDPRNVIPKAINNVPIRILLFYVGGLLVIMSVIPWNKIDSNSSPFVTMFSLIGFTIRCRTSKLCSINCRCISNKQWYLF